MCVKDGPRSNRGWHVYGLGVPRQIDVKGTYQEECVGSRRSPAASGAWRVYGDLDRTVSNFQLRGTEINGSRLLKTDAGKAAITSILEWCIPDTRLVFHYKTYALACKMFEYIFEPSTSSCARSGVIASPT